jgi:hypothetical protein
MEATSQMSAFARRAWRTFLLYRDEAIRAREAAVLAERSPRTNAELRSLYVLPRVAAREMEAMAAPERRAYDDLRRGRLAPLGTAALALVAVVAVMIVLLAPTIV